MDIFKNLKSLTIPSHFNLGSYPLVSQIWNNKTYHKKLIHLNINLKDIIIDSDGDNHVNNNHDQTEQRTRL